MRAGSQAVLVPDASEAAKDSRACVQAIRAAEQRAMAHGGAW